MYLLKKFQKLIRDIFIPQYGLQKLKVSRDLEKLVYKVVETPWITPNTYSKIDKSDNLREKQCTKIL
jgi:hypothetical protein